MIKKSNIVSSGNIQKGEIPNPELRFSFKFFDNTDSELCPPRFGENYTQVLMGRLKDMSSMTLKDFLNSSGNKSLRIHTHDWSVTSRPVGFSHLPKHLQNCLGWQFQLSSNEHGRVHGILIDHTFYVIWLDKDHMLYSSK